MRLICPKCGAQYEVDPQVVPPNGRDVQCSNCEHTWFQVPEKTKARETQPTPSAQVTPPAKAPTPAPTAPEPQAVHTPERELPLPNATAASPRSAVSDSVRDILRSEVEFDNSVRKSASTPLETQPDLGLESVPAYAPTAPKPPQEQSSAKRRDLLPDIEEINSSLTATPTPQIQSTVASNPKTRSKRSGFAMSFAFIVILACALVALYIFAPRLSEQAPQLAGPLSEFTTYANVFRGWLNELTSAASSSLDMILELLHGTAK